MNLIFTTFLVDVNHVQVHEYTPEGVEYENKLVSSPY
jgi:hypothetical protein